MKICLICSEYPPGPHGGIGTINQLLARRLVSMGHEVRVAGVYFKNYGQADYEEDQGVKVWRIRRSDGKFGFILPWMRQYKLIKSWVDEDLIDIVEAPESMGWFAFWPYLKIPCVLRAHGSETEEKISLGRKPNRLTRMLEQKSYTRADAYSAVSKYSAEAAKKTFLIHGNFEIIYNGIEFIEMPDLPRKDNTVVFAGTLSEKKGIVTLVRAVSELFTEGIIVELDIFGKDSSYNGGSMMAYLQGLMPENMIQHVHFHGHVTRERLLDSYTTCTMAVFPSQWESFGLAPVEAMMCGAPVIHTTIPTGFELIDDGLNGILTDPHDFNQLAKQMKRLLEGTALRKNLGINAIKKVKDNFTLEAMTRSMANFYERQINEFKSKSR